MWTNKGAGYQLALFYWRKGTGMSEQVMQQAELIIQDELKKHPRGYEFSQWGEIGTKMSDSLFREIANEYLQQMAENGCVSVRHGFQQNPIQTARFLEFLQDRYVASSEFNENYNRAKIETKYLEEEFRYSRGEADYRLVEQAAREAGKSLGSFLKEHHLTIDYNVYALIPECAVNLTVDMADTPDISDFLQPKQIELLKENLNKADFLVHQLGTALTYLIYEQGYTLEDVATEYYRQAGSILPETDSPFVRELAHALHEMHEQGDASAGVKITAALNLNREYDVLEHIGRQSGKITIPSGSELYLYNGDFRSSSFTIEQSLTLSAAKPHDKTVGIAGIEFPYYDTEQPEHPHIGMETDRGYWLLKKVSLQSLPEADQTEKRIHEIALFDIAKSAENIVSMAEAHQVRQNAKAEKEPEI